jgi:hypothetical protein
MPASSVAPEVETQKTTMITAFCHCCPSVTAVTQTLHAAGCHLQFSMDAISPPSWASGGALPAQYHYTGPFGVEVLFLAGRDSSRNGERLPPHAARFWIDGSPGQKSGDIQQRIVSLLHLYVSCWRDALTQEKLYYDLQASRLDRFPPRKKPTKKAKRRS